MAASFKNGGVEKEESMINLPETFSGKSNYENFVLGGTLGYGEISVVKKATRANGEQVAIKIIRKKFAPLPYVMKFIPRELDTIKKLNHPNIVKFHFSVDTTDRVYIVMELLEGSLLNEVQKKHFIPENQTRVWFLQLMSAVVYIHEKGIVHRDIKCENILLSKAMTIKLSDFGFARDKGPMSTTFCGSPVYAAPEILKEMPYQPKFSDIWSMGVVLYALLYGQLPFTVNEYWAILKQKQIKLAFPLTVTVSAACKILLRKLIAPVRERIYFPQLQSDQWVQFGQTLSSHKDKDDSATLTKITTVHTNKKK